MKITRLSDFLQKQGDEFNKGELPLETFFIQCSWCGSSDVILRGKAQRKLKGEAQRYGCKNCGLSLAAWGFGRWIKRFSDKRRI